MFCLHQGEELSKLVQASQFEKVLHRVAHDLSYRGVVSKTQKLNKTACLSWKKEYNTWWVYKPCTMILVFYLASCVDWSTVKDSTWWGFKASNSPFCKSRAAMSFPKFCFIWKDFNTLENRKQSLIPFLLLLTSLSLSYLLHKSMLHELFGEASKRRNKKQEAKRKKKIEQEKLEGKSLIISSTLSYLIILSVSQWRQH